MSLARTEENKLPHLNQLGLADIWLSSGRKYSRQQYNYIISRIETEVSDVTRSMLNASDHGFGFLRLAIHPGSTPSSMAIIYEKITNQTPWKYKPTAVKFIDALDSLFRFAAKNEETIKKHPLNSAPFNNKEEYLEAFSELTTYYIVRLLEQNVTALAS